MIRIYRMIWQILTPRERQRYLVLLALMIVMSLAEVVGVAIILPFLTILSDPSLIDTHWLLLRFKAVTGLTDRLSVTIALGIAVFLVISLGMVARAVGSYAEMRFGLMRAYTLGSRLLAGYLKQPYAFFLSRNSADFGQNLLSEVDLVVRESILPALLLISSSVIALLVVGLLVVVQPYVALGATILLVTSYTGVYQSLRGLLARIGADRFAANRDRFLVVNEAMGGLKEVKLAGLEDEIVQRFASPALAMAQQQTLALTIGRLPRFALEAVVYGGFILMVLIMVAADSRALDDALPTFGMMGVAGMKLFPALQAVYNNLSLLRYSTEALTRMHQSIMQLSTPMPEPDTERPVLRLTRELSLHEVSFRYPMAEAPSLAALSLSIPAHSTIGIVGGTGAGKTTMVDLILGLLRPDAGEIRVDGEVLSDDRLRSWQKRLGYVPQSIYLSDSSVAANIAFGVAPERVDQAAVERAARIANLHDFVVNDLPEGYATLVGERGVRLSGGQRQRIGIARALYHDPDLLILDEATSALDNLTEKAVMEAVQNLGRAKTVIMIAHRLTTVRDCDVIFFLARGKLEAAGSYSELMETSASFRLLAQA